MLLSLNVTARGFLLQPAEAKANRPAADKHRCPGRLVVMTKHSWCVRGQEPTMPIPFQHGAITFCGDPSRLGTCKDLLSCRLFSFRARRKRPGYPAGKGRSRGQNHAFRRPGVPKDVAGSSRFGATRKQLKGIRQCVQPGQRRACFHFACEPYGSLLGKHREGLAGRHTSSIATTARASEIYE